MRKYFHVNMSSMTFSVSSTFFQHLFSSNNNWKWNFEFKEVASCFRNWKYFPHFSCCWHRDTQTLSMAAPLQIQIIYFPICILSSLDMTTVLECVVLVVWLLIQKYQGRLSMINVFSFDYSPSLTAHTSHLSHNDCSPRSEKLTQYISTHGRWYLIKWELTSFPTFWQQLM